MSRDTLAVLDPAALIHNYEQTRRLAAGSRSLAVIKANAYGHGLEWVVSVLKQADGFAVATVDEAVRTRDAGFAGQLLVLEGIQSEDELSPAHAMGLDLVFHHQSQLDWLSCQPLDFSNSRLWLKVDTGMHRLGFEPEEASDAWDSLHRVTDKRILMGHLSCADEPDNEITRDQNDELIRIGRQLGASQMSMANSAAVLQWPQTHHQYVRPGLMLYGVSPVLDSHASDFKLNPVMTLTSRIISIKQCRQGDRVGYGGLFTCPSDMQIATVAIGYGDGYPVAATNRAQVLVGQQSCPVIGRVSMDMTCIDVTALKSVAINDEVILWGEGMPVDKVANDCGMLNYELICGITQRVRADFRNSGVVES